MRVACALILSAALAGPSLMSVAEAGTLEEISQSGTIKIGYRESEPPMSFIDQDGNPAGYSIDLCMRIVNGVKKTLNDDKVQAQFVPVHADNRFSALAENKIDILCGSTTKTLSRSELVDFTQLTFVTGASLLSAKASRVDGIAGLQGGKVAVVQGTTTIDAVKMALQEAVADAEIVPVETAAEGLEALRKGEVNAFSSDQVVLIGLMLTEPDGQDFVISSHLFSFEPFALAVRRNDADFRLAADRVLSQLYRTGQINQIYSKWFGRFSKKRPDMINAVYRLNATPE